MLVLGARGIPYAHLRPSLESWADVVVASSRDVLARRPDAAALAGTTLVLARDLAELPQVIAEARDTVPVQGVFTVSEDAVATTAVIADRLGLPGLPVSAVPALSDKLAQREALRAAGVPTPAFAEVDAADGSDDVTALLDKVPLPAVLKPTHGSGSALVYRCHTPGELRAALAGRATAHASAGGAIAVDSRYLLESLLVGVPSHPVPGFAPYVSVETLVEHGVHHHLAVTDRFPLAAPSLETGMMLPSCLDSADRSAVEAAASDALRAVDLRHGVAHTEVMLTADGPRIIEVNARVGGALPYLFPLAFGCDVVTQAARLALDLPVARQVSLNGHAMFVAPQHHIGRTVIRVDGIADAARLPGVRAAIPAEVGGGGPRLIGFDNSLMAAVIATIPDPRAAVALYRDVLHLVRPYYAEPPVPAAAG